MCFACTRPTPLGAICIRTLEFTALEPAQKRGDAAFQFQVYAREGKQYSVETTTNLALDAWTPFTNILATNVPVDVVDITATNSPVKFYRTLEN